MGDEYMKTIKTLLSVLSILLLSTVASASHERTISNICQELWKSGKIQFFPSKICLHKKTVVNTDNTLSQSEKDVTVRQTTTHAENLSSNKEKDAFSEHMPPVDW
ncbi:hypothetical protein REG_1449 [Candidatus Regiella insecticola LSR1]|uniref:Uncharacterized protein n=2 Tax=Candidatus Regiella insecticola TaxID=138073 RepID=E0WTS4_9ENTR|nr:hypothetical protein REG_1449 [Candidatus Regiella insecticola LSR1]